MSDTPSTGIIDALHNLVGGGATVLFAAAIGRVMYVAGEVRARRRPLLSLDLLWELPLVVGMGLIGDGLSGYLALSDRPAAALIATLSYLGPRGAGALLERWIAKKGG